MRINLKPAILFTSILGLCACSSPKEIDLSNGAPAYENSKGEFSLYGYRGPETGYYYEDGDKNTGEDYRTVERYRQYKEAGLNTYLCSDESRYKGESYEQSDLKMVLDRLHEAGVERAIVFDDRLYFPAGTVGGEKAIKIGDLKKADPYNNFSTSKKESEIATDEDLEVYVQACVKDYSKHPSFHGLVLFDEPSYNQFTSVGRFYKAIKKVLPQSYVLVNLLPLNPSVKTHYARDIATPLLEAYEKYLTSYLEKTGSDEIVMDSYPIRYDGKNHSLGSYHYQGLQILSKVCDKHKAKLGAVAQSCSEDDASGPSLGPVDAATMNWQLNLYMGFGVQSFGYWTYWRFRVNMTGFMWHPYGTSFIDTDGTVNPLYYTMQTIHEQMQKFAPVITNFSFLNSKSYVNTPVAYSTAPYASAFSPDEEKDFVKAKQYSAEPGDFSFVNELIDDKNNDDPSDDQYMYMVMNGMDPDYVKNDPNTALDGELRFDPKEYNAALVYYKGQSRKVILKEGIYKTHLEAGYAEYVMPYFCPELNK